MFVRNRARFFVFLRAAFVLIGILGVGFELVAQSVDDVGGIENRSSVRRFDALGVFPAESFRAAEPAKLPDEVAPQACTGTATSRTCNAAGPITLNSTTATGTAPQTASIYPSDNVVSGMSGTITSVQVRLNGFTHTWLHDNDMVLVAPTGERFVFWSDVGTAGNIEGNPITNFTLTISDSGTIDLPQGTPVNNTTYRPRNYNTTGGFFDIFPAPANFSATAANSAAPTGTQTFAGAFNGLNPNGTWRLYIALDSAPDTGSLQSWDLIIGTTVANAPTTTSLTSSANPAVIPLSGNSQGTITATVTSAGNPVTLGVVSFFNGAQALATNVPLNASGQASVTFNTTGSTAPVLGEGSYNITANYSGASGFGSSNGNLTQVVDRATQVTGNTFCNTGRITIPQAVGAATVYPSKIFVSGLSGSIQSVVMDINGFTNPATDDVNMLLVSPTGQKFVPFAYISRFDAVTTGANIRLDDLSGNILPTTGPVASGTYRPSHGLNGTTPSPVTFVSPAPAAPYNSPEPFGSATFTSTFSGASPNGTWTLYIVNWGGTNVVGTREITNGWCVTIGSSSDPATTTTVATTPSPSALNQSVTISATVRNATTNAPVNALGTVTFREGNVVLAANVPVNASGVASFTKSDFTQGSHFVDASYNGSPGNFGVSNGQTLHYVDAPTTNPSAGRFCNTTPLTFPNVVNATGLPYPTRINATGLAGTLQRVTLELNGFSHQFPDDIDLMLTGPNGNSLVAFSDVGGGNAVSGLNFVLDSTAASPLPDATTLSSGTFQPTDFQVNLDSFLTPAPTTNVFSAFTSTFPSVFGGSNPNGIWTLWPRNDSAGAQGGGSLSGGWCVNLTMNQPQLTVSKTHVGNFVQGQIGAQYTVTVGSAGPGSTVGTITLVENPPAGLTVTGLSGNGWTCTVGTRTCTNSTPIAANTTLPPITVTVNVAADATSPQVNSVSVSGGGALGATANDETTITVAPDLAVSKSTSSRFVRGGTARYTFVVTNQSSGATTANFSINDPLPAGLTVSGINIPNGSGWNCSATPLNSTTISCLNTNQLAGSTSSAPLGVDVRIAANTPSSITNTVVVSGGGQVNTGNDSGSVTSTVFDCQPDMVVTNTTDADAGSLRDAVLNSCPNSTITFSNAVQGRILLTSGEILIDRNLTIQGSANRIIEVRNGAAPSRVFRISSPSSASLSRLNVTGGSATAGGGFLNQGGTLVLNEITLAENTASGGGGAISSEGGAVLISNSTISGNSAGSNGGGVNAINGVLNLQNVTIANNTATNSGGGVNVGVAQVTARNSLIAGNSAPTAPDFAGVLNSFGFNLLGNSQNTTIAGTTTGNILNQLPRLAPLGFYGGSTLTHALLSTSPAINAGNGNPSPTLDQRGAARVGLADIGSFELNNTANGGSYVALLPDGQVNVGYNFVLIPEAGTTTYCLASGSLPPGVTGVPSCLVGADGNPEQVVPAAAVALSGTPTFGGLYNFSISATNGANTNVTNYRLAVINPTSAAVSVGGRVVTSDGTAVNNAIVSIIDQNGVRRSIRTGTFGYFLFDAVPAGVVHTVEVQAKGLQFTPQIIEPSEDVTQLVFVGQ